LCASVWNNKKSVLILLTVLLFQVIQAHNSNVCYGVSSYSLELSHTATLLYGYNHPYIVFYLFISDVVKFQIWKINLKTHHNQRRISYYMRNQQDATLAVSFISHCKITLFDYDIVQWQPTLDILTGYISSRPMTSGCYYSY